MHTEIESAVKFLINVLSQRFNLSEATTATLTLRLTELLIQRFENHWYPNKPIKGSAYRCINISIDDGSVDSVLLQAGKEVNISKNDLVSVFSKGLALWIDPNDVSCRLGKGAIFPISRKIADQKSYTPVSNVPVHSQRRPQRPRSISPPMSAQKFNNQTYQQPQQHRPRSTTPPGFSSADAGQMYQSLPKKNNSLENLHKLWDTIPNTTSFVPSTSIYQTPTPTISRMYRQQQQQQQPQQRQSDAVYSFNQYSSYYNSTAMRKKNTSFNGGNKQPKQMWQDDETYNKYHWSRNERNASPVNAYNQSALSYGGYSFGRQAQEVC